MFEIVLKRKTCLLTILHSERLKLYTILAFLSATGLTEEKMVYAKYIIKAFSRTFKLLFDKESLTKKEHLF